MLAERAICLLGLFCLGVGDPDAQDGVTEAAINLLSGFGPLVLRRPHWVTICHQNQVPQPMARAVKAVMTWKWTNGPAAQVVTQAGDS
jgi:hypothetical protein